MLTVANILATSRWLANGCEIIPLKEFGDTDKFNKRTFCDQIND